jgi:hypothetical protein
MRLSLKRLRAAFLALGLVLLGALFLLVSSALARLDRQRELRHEVVAERIFDELERELTAHLIVESERPSEAYDALSTSPSAWAPFVVGYFTVSDGYRVVARDQLAAPRVQRLERALASVWPAPAGVPEPQATPADLSRLDQPALEVPKNKAVQSSPEVLRRLNRASEERKQQEQRISPKPKTSHSPRSKDSHDEDPFLAL